jgi:hypothetical protein
MNKDAKLLAEAYNKVLKEEDLSPERGPDEAFKHLDNALSSFYAIGQKGLGPDPKAINDRVYNMLQKHQVDDKDMQRFSDALTSIILGQSTLGYADMEAKEYEHKGWAGDGTGEDDFADYNQNEGNDY